MKTKILYTALTLTREGENKQEREGKNSRKQMRRRAENNSAAALFHDR